MAFAIVDSEDEDNWRWCLQQLVDVVGEERTLTFISDRNKGLLAALPKVFPSAHHAFCLHHLKGNLRDKLKGWKKSFRESIVFKFRECAYAPTEDAFNEKLSKLVEEGGNKVKDFLADCPFKNWTNAHFQGQRYGEMWSNVAESFNSWIRDARNLPITKMVDLIRSKLMNQMAIRRKEASKWGSVLCPNMDARLSTELDKGRTWRISMSSEYVFEVHSDPSVTVDISRHTCSCHKWQLNGFPCEHASVVIQNNGLDLNYFIEWYFHVHSFQAAYADSIYPITTSDKPNNAYSEYEVILPPFTRRQPGRPKKCRIPSKGEKIAQIRCSRCGRLGNHNKKTCKNPI